MLLELLSYNLKIHIKRKNEKLPEVSAGNRLVWCPYVVGCSEEEDEENVSERMLSVCVGRVAEVYDLDMLTEEHEGDTVDVDAITTGIVRVRGHTSVSVLVVRAHHRQCMGVTSRTLTLDTASGD